MLYTVAPFILQLQQTGCILYYFVLTLLVTWVLGDLMWVGFCAAVQKTLLQNVISFQTGNEEDLLLLKCSY